MRINPRESYPWYLRPFLKGWAMPLKIWGRVPRLFFAFTLFWRALNQKKTRTFFALVNVRVAEINNCPFCIRFNASQVRDRQKVEALKEFRTSELFSEKERVALEYAEAITYSDREVDDALFEKVKQHFSEDEIVELTAMIAFENCSSKFNKALEII